MWEVVSLVSCTLILRRTEHSMTDPQGDEWWTQKYNRHRVSRKRDIFISDKPVDRITSLELDKRLFGEQRKLEGVHHSNSQSTAPISVVFLRPDRFVNSGAPVICVWP